MKDNNVPTLLTRFGLFNSSSYRDFASGGVAGAATGLFIGPMEALKVKFQVEGPPKRSNYLSINFYRQLMKMTPHLSYCFAMTCALEFSVNESIKKKYHPVAGLFSSALTGAVFLTISDHLMFRTLRGESLPTVLNNFRSIGYNKLLTGLGPMVIREGHFISSVLYFGPQLGNYLQNHYGKEDGLASTLKWSALGTSLAGLGTTFLSQPWDCFAREMQKQVEENPQTKPRLVDTIKNTSMTKMFRGAIPRLALSSVGGAMAGTFFRYLTEKSPEENEKIIDQKQENPIARKAVPHQAKEASTKFSYSPTRIIR